MGGSGEGMTDAVWYDTDTTLINGMSPERWLDPSWQVLYSISRLRIVVRPALESIINGI
tara:strand:+ start:481 stop:657 length:177 start_codon:yes stop_codon:yes gene_type:complete